MALYHYNPDEKSPHSPWTMLDVKSNDFDCVSGGGERGGVEVIS